MSNPASSQGVRWEYIIVSASKGLAGGAENIASPSVEPDVIEMAFTQTNTLNENRRKLQLEVSIPHEEQGGDDSYAHKTMQILQQNTWFLNVF